MSAISQVCIDEHINSNFFAFRCHFFVFNKLCLYNCCVSFEKRKLYNHHVNDGLFKFTISLSFYSSSVRELNVEMGRDLIVHI